MCASKVIYVFENREGKENWKSKFEKVKHKNMLKYDIIINPIFAVERSKNIPGVELWDKRKLGKDPLRSYLAQIEHSVGSFCAAHVLDDPRFADVSKSRLKESRSDVDTEMCSITPVRGQGTWRVGNPRGWLSFAVESSEENILSVLKSNRDYRLMFATLEICLCILRSQRNDALANSFFPVLAGYPGWLSVIFSETPHESHDLIYDDCVKLLEIMEYIANRK